MDVLTVKIKLQQLDTSTSTILYTCPPISDLHYRQRIELDGQVVELEIVDVSQGSRDAAAPGSSSSSARLLSGCPRLPLSRLRAADAVVVMYAVTDRVSFHEAREALEAMRQEEDEDGEGEEDEVDVPVLLLANKVDLSHLRKVGSSSKSLSYNTHILILDKMWYTCTVYWYVYTCSCR